MVKLELTFKKRNDVIESSVVHVSSPLWQDNQVIPMIRNCLVREIQVHHFFDGSAQIGKVLHIDVVLHNGGLSTKVALEHLHVRVKSHANLLDELVRIKH